MIAKRAQGLGKIDLENPSCTGPEPARGASPGSFKFANVTRPATTPSRHQGPLEAVPWAGHQQSDRPLPRF